MKFSAVILAGGKSSRMGRDKAFLEIGGETLLARQIELAKKIGASEIFISGRLEKNYSEFGCHVLRDEFSGAGPLAGIEAALRAAQNQLLLVLAVDLPQMKMELLEKLRAASSENCGSVPRLENEIEPLAAFYTKTAWILANSHLQQNDLAVKPFAEKCVQSKLATWLDLPPDDKSFFANLNSADDVRLFGADKKLCTN